MSESIFLTIKPIKFIGNIFSFLPFIIDKNHEMYQKVYPINCIYALILTSILSFVMYFNFTAFTDFFKESSLIPTFIDRIIQTIPVVINISQTCGTFIHRQSFWSLSEHFKQIDSKVSSSNPSTFSLQVPKSSSIFLIVL
ncbi:hypothetical protein ACKWTF_016290 [Chironomus riparius]